MKRKLSIVAIPIFFLYHYSFGMLEQPDWKPTIESSTQVYFSSLVPGVNALEVKIDGTLEMYASGPMMLHNPNVAVGKWEWKEEKILKAILVLEPKYDVVSTWDGYIYFDKNTASWEFFKTIEEAKKKRKLDETKPGTGYSEDVKSFREKYKI